jgi:hypothetical protein
MAGEATVLPLAGLLTVTLAKRGEEKARKSARNSAGREGRAVFMNYLWGESSCLPGTSISAKCSVGNARRKRF